MLDQKKVKQYLQKFEDSFQKMSLRKKKKIYRKPLYYYKRIHGLKVIEIEDPNRKNLLIINEEKRGVEYFFALSWFVEEHRLPYNDALYVMNKLPHEIMGVLKYFVETKKKKFFLLHSSYDELVIISKKAVERLYCWGFTVELQERFIKLPRSDQDKILSLLWSYLKKKIDFVDFIETYAIDLRTRKEAFFFLLNRIFGYFI